MVSKSFRTMASGLAICNAIFLLCMAASLTGRAAAASATATTTFRRRTATRPHPVFPQEQGQARRRIKKGKAGKSEYPSEYPFEEGMYYGDDRYSNEGDDSYDAPGAPGGSFPPTPPPTTSPTAAPASDVDGRLPVLPTRNPALGVVTTLPPIGRVTRSPVVSPEEVPVLPVLPPAPAPTTTAAPTIAAAAPVLSPVPRPTVAVPSTPVAIAAPTGSPASSGGGGAVDATSAPAGGVGPGTTPPPPSPPTAISDPCPEDDGAIVDATNAPAGSPGTTTTPPPTAADAVSPGDDGGIVDVTAAPAGSPGTTTTPRPTAADASPGDDGGIVDATAAPAGSPGTTTTPRPTTRPPTTPRPTARPPTSSGPSPNADGSSGEPEGDGRIESGAPSAETASETARPSTSPTSEPTTGPTSSAAPTMSSVPTIAPTMSMEPSGSAEPTAPGPTVSLTAEFCADTSPDKELQVRWLYAVEFEPELSEDGKTSAISIMELKLVSELLDCDPARRRGRNVRGRLLLTEGVAGLDYKPDDVRSGEISCPSNSTCTSYIGIMTLYLEQTVNGEASKQDLLFGIRDSMQKTDFPQVDGIAAVWYLEPELSGKSGIEEGGGEEGTNSTVGPAVSEGAVVAFAALGLFVFAALTLAVYRVRSNRSGEDGALTIQAGSTATGVDSYPSKAISPFSAMLPKAYALHDPDTMSAILEGDSDSDSRAQSSVIVSDGGYTSDGDSQQDSLYTQTISPVLGAQKFDDDNLENDRAFLFETDTDDAESIHRALRTTYTTGTDDQTVKRGTPTKLK